MHRYSNDLFRNDTTGNKVNGRGEWNTSVTVSPKLTLGLNFFLLVSEIVYESGCVISNLIVHIRIQKRQPGGGGGPAYAPMKLHEVSVCLSIKSLYYQQEPFHEKTKTHPSST